MSNHWEEQEFNKLTNYLQSSPSFLRKGRMERFTVQRQEDIVSFIVETMSLPYSDAILRYIDGKGYNDVDIYKKAKVDRRVFSKLRSSADYQPSRKTAIRLCLALEMDLSEAMMIL